MALVSVALVAVAAGCASGDGEAAPEELAAERIVVGGAPWGVAVDGDSVWVSDASRGVVVELDGRSRQPRREVPTGAPDPRDAGMAIDGGRLWVANLGGTVGVVDLASAAPSARLEVGPGEPAAVAVAGGTAWVPLHGSGGGLARLDATRLEAARRVELPESAFSVALDGATVWTGGLDRRVFAVDATRGAVTRTVDVGGAPRGVAVAAGDVWVTSRDRRQVVRIDGATGEILKRIPTDGQPWPVAAGAGFVWVAELEGRLLRIDPRSDRVTATAPTAPQPRTIAVGAGAVWVASQTGVVSRIAVRRGA